MKDPNIEALAKELFDVVRRNKSHLYHKNDTWEGSLTDNGRKGFLVIAGYVIKTYIPRSKVVMSIDDIDKMVKEMVDAIRKAEQEEIGE